MAKKTEKKTDTETSKPSNNVTLTKSTCEEQYIAVTDDDQHNVNTMQDDGQSVKETIESSWSDESRALLDATMQNLISNNDLVEAIDNLKYSDPFEKNSCTIQDEIIRDWNDEEYDEDALLKDDDDSNILAGDKTMDTAAEEMDTAAEEMETAAEEKGLL